MLENGFEYKALAYKLKELVDESKNGLSITQEEFYKFMCREATYFSDYDINAWDTYGVGTKKYFRSVFNFVIYFYKKLYKYIEVYDKESKILTLKLKTDKENDKN